MPEPSVVTETGKIHESLFRTEAEPFQIHTAMLLLGAKGAGTNRFPEQANQPLPGDKVTIEVTWRMEGGAWQNRRAEELVYNQQTKSTMSRGPWIYNGSRMFDGTFVAQQDGSIVSLIEDPDAARTTRHDWPDRGCAPAGSHDCAAAIRRRR